MMGRFNANKMEKLLVEVGVGESSWKSGSASGYSSLGRRCLALIVRGYMIGFDLIACSKNGIANTSPLNNLMILRFH